VANFEGENFSSVHVALCTAWNTCNNSARSNCSDGIDGRPHPYIRSSSPGKFLSASSAIFYIGLSG